MELAILGKKVISLYTELLNIYVPVLSIDLEMY